MKVTIVWKTGPSIVLKVMTGDKFNAVVNSWWKDPGGSGTTPANPGTAPLADFLSAMNNAVGAVSGSHQGVTTTELSGSNVLEDAVTSQFTAQDGGYVATKGFFKLPACQAGVLLDDQFNYVAGSSGFKQVEGSEVYSTLVSNSINVEKSGYLYIYVSNVTTNIDSLFRPRSASGCSLITCRLLSPDHAVRLDNACKRAITGGNALLPLWVDDGGDQ